MNGLTDWDSIVFNMTWDTDLDQPGNIFDDFGLYHVISDIMVVCILRIVQILNIEENDIHL